MSATTAQVFRLPDLGEGLTEAEVVEWHVAVGDHVGIDQEVVTVETAKAAVEVPCPYAGAVVELHAEPGSVLAVGAPLITVSDGTDPAADDQGAGDGGTDPTHPAGEQYRTEERAGARTPDPDEGGPDAGEGGPDAGEGGSAPERPLIGYGAAEGPARRSRAGRRHAGAAGALGTARVAADGAGRDEQRNGSSHETRGDRAVRVISPLVRKLAEEWGIELGAVRPGPTGVIRRADLEAFRESDLEAYRDSGEPATTQAHDGAPAVPSGATTAHGPRAHEGPGADHGPGAHDGHTGEDVRVPIQGVHRVMVERLTTSRREIPDATTWVDVDATRLMKTKDALQGARPDARIGVLPLLARFVVSGLTAYPALNSSVDLEAQEVVQHRRIHLGFAAQSPRGLVVPVVRDAGSMTTSELAAALHELTQRARDGKLTPAELTGGTFTLNNYGVFGVDGSTPIINHPEAAMLGVGRIVDKPWVHKGRLKVRAVTQLSFTFDHRVCDGATAGGFLRHVADLVEQPAALLADV